VADQSFKPAQGEIALRAYEIYLSRGQKNGGDIDDWLAAEQELASGNPSRPRPKSS
jgi:Protein of unknown function (DUF2934)